MSEKPRILIIEDEEVASGAILMLLRHYGHSAILATTLAEGKRLVKQPLDVIVLDLHLPDGGGIDLLETLRMTGSMTRVIVLTGSNDAALERRVRRFMPQALFHKPLNFFEVFEAILAGEGEASVAA